MTMEQRTTSRPSRPTAEAGFTLVELAIVLVIIGLIIGGVLRGQEMIESARLKSGISQLDAVRAAHITFVDKYGAFPGDLAGAEDIIAGAPAWAADGDNDRIMDGAQNTAENLYYWQHMAAAGMVSGVEVAETPVVATTIPAFSVDGVLVVDSLAVAGSTDNWFYTAVGVASAAGVLSGEQAFEIDQKIDDARPGTGDVRQDQAACNQGTGAVTAASAYDRAGGASCRVLVRFP